MGRRRRKNMSPVTQPLPEILVEQRFRSGQTVIQIKTGKEFVVQHHDHQDPIRGLTLHGKTGNFGAKYFKPK